MRLQRLLANGQNLNCLHTSSNIVYITRNEAAMVYAYVRALN